MIELAEGGHYRLAPHAFIAEVSGALIILDRRRDEYLFLSNDDRPAVLEALGAGDYGVGSDTRAAAGALLEHAGLAVRATDAGAQWAFLDHYDRSVEMPGPRIDAVPRVGLRDIVRFAGALAKSVYYLDGRGFTAAVASVERLRDHRVTEQSDPHVLADLVEIYRRIKPLLLPDKDRCLMNSLVLLHFLAAYRVYPRWVFGVRLHPFEAHCWVEDDAWVFNDQFSRIDEFTPIMRV